MKAINIILFSMILVISAYAQRINYNFSLINYGQELSFVTARTLAMGGAGIAGGDAFMAVSHNPALAAKATSAIHLNAGLTVYKLEEDRAFPYFDNFGGFVDYGSYYFNKKWYLGSFGIVSGRIPSEAMSKFSYALGVLPFKDFDYEYMEEVRSNTFGDELLAYNIINSEGRLYAVPLNVAFQPLDNLSLGVGLNLLFGSQEIRERVEVVSTSLDEDIAYNVTSERKLDNMPIIPALGIHYQYDERLAAALSFRAPYEIEFKISDQLDNDLKQTLSYPAQFGFGMDYRFQNVLEARVFVDLVFEFWEDFEDDLNEDLQFENTYQIRAGVEHIFFSKVPFRVGFNHGTVRESKDFTTTTLAIGTGLQVGEFRFDMGIGVSSMEYKQLDLFDDGDYGLPSRSSLGNTGIRTDIDRVQWNTLYARVDVNYSF